MKKIDHRTDFYAYTDNFSSIEKIPVKTIKKSVFQKPPLISIAIPTYKRPDLLKESLDSAINQTSKLNYEILVVDNHPERDDETERLLNSYSNCPNLAYYKNSDNIGMVGNWNRLYLLAKGKWVVMLHDDDMLLPEYVEEVLNYLDERYLVIHPGCVMLHNGEYQWKKSYSKKVRISRYYDLPSMGIFNILGAPTCCIYNKSKVIESGGFNPDCYPTSDYTYWIYALKKGYWLASLNKTLGVYRIAQNESLDIQVMERILYNDYFISKFILEHEVPFYKYFAKTIISCWTYENVRSMSCYINKQISIPKDLDVYHNLIFPQFCIYKLLRLYLGLRYLPYRINEHLKKI